MKFDINNNSKIWKNFIEDQLVGVVFDFDDLQAKLKEHNATITPEDARDSKVSFNSEQDLVYFIMRWS